MNSIRSLASLVLRSGWYAGVKADAVVGSQFTKEGQELAFAASDFDNRLVAQVETRNEVFSESFVECGERARKTLRLFVLRRVVDEFFRKNTVCNEAGCRTKRQLDVAERKRKCLLMRAHQQHAVHRAHPE